MITQDDSIETPESLSEIRESMKLSIEERGRILAEQAEAMLPEYELESNRFERELWQGGDIVEHQYTATLCCTLACKGRTAW